MRAVSMGAVRAGPRSQLIGACGVDAPEVLPVPVRAPRRRRKSPCPDRGSDNQGCVECCVKGGRQADVPSRAGSTIAHMGNIG